MFNPVLYYSLIIKLCDKDLRFIFFQCPVLAE